MSGLGPSADPPVTPVLLVATAVEAVVLLAAGGGLLFQPDLTRALWPWELSPFNTAFLGAIYLGALGPILVMLWTRRWAPARVVVPMIGLFTLSVLAVSLLTLDRFELALRPVISAIWFVLYVALPANAVVHLLLWRRLASPGRPPVPRAWGRYLAVLAVIFGGYGAGMLVAPEAFTAFWPWDVDPFHGQLYAATFLTGGLGLWLVARAAQASEFLAVAVLLTLFGGLAIAGTLAVDRSAERIDWGSAGTLSWLGALALAPLTGAAMALASRRILPSTAQTTPAG